MLNWHRGIQLFCVLVLVGLWMMNIDGVSAAATSAEDDEQRARRFIQRHESTIAPLEIEVNRHWWTANVSGKDDDYRRKLEAETKLNMALADPEAFAELKAIRAGQIADPIVRRQIDVLYLQYLGKQVDPELLKRIVEKANLIEQAFNVHRPRINGKELTDNEVRRVLRISKHSAERKAVWEASKTIGSVVEKDLKELVRLRNQAARKLGFGDYHKMQLYLAEQDQEQVLRVFDELDELTRKPFRQAKAEIDALLAKQCNISVEELRPWHYHDPFFQESPDVFHEGSEAFYSTLDVVKLCREFFGGIGLPVEGILARSDLYEKKGKNPHAFSLDIDRAGDVRVLANVVPNRQWLDTMLHELGHAVYSENISRKLPYVLRTEAHPLTTEGVAMMFGRLADDAGWLEAMGVKLPDAERFRAAAEKRRRNALLIFSRWCQVMVRFEAQLYANPDQDLNKLWWDLVEKYQEVKRPEDRNLPDYAAKIHIVSAPAYYHNYMFGEMFASQLHHTIAREVLGGVHPRKAVYVGNKGVGRFMIERVFAPGLSMDWNALTRHATGKDLGPADFAADLQVD